MLRSIAKTTIPSILSLAMLLGLTMKWSVGHEHTLPAARQRQREARTRLVAQAQAAESVKRQSGVCQLTVELVGSASNRPLAGNVRISDVETGAPLALSELISRPEDWWSMPSRATIEVPRARLRVAAFHGMETKLAERTLDLRDRAEAVIRVPLERLYDAAERQLVGGNTHLHLNRISRAAADRYLRIVPHADDLDLLYVSHLLRAGDDETYITNQYDAAELARLSTPRVTLRHGEEHRHNFEAYGEGYGHVMMLDIKRLIQPVSIGPGLMKTGTDGIPLRRGIDQARQDGATVIWCHNSFGVEDLANWMSGVLHAQNIFDGGDHGGYQDTYYRYLNVGLKVPFSTGTDWFIYDLSRVYVPLREPASSEAWLRELARGRSFITNGTFLEFEANGHPIGDVVEVGPLKSVHVRGRGIGRNDFNGLELVHNGTVVHRVDARKREGLHEAVLDFDLRVGEPGWIGLRVPLQAGRNEFGRTLFAHTSPIYLEWNGKRIFDRDTAQGLLAEMERNISLIKSKAVFDTPEEREAVLTVHRQGIAALQRRLENAVSHK